jgi:hypothetical protein
MMETTEYLGTLTRSLVSHNLGKDKILWGEGETVILKEIDGNPKYFRIIKLQNTLGNMVVPHSAFIYYRPDWVKLR